MAADLYDESAWEGADTVGLARALCRSKGWKFGFKEITDADRKPVYRDGRVEWKVWADLPGQQHCYPTYASTLGYATLMFLRRLFPSGVGDWELRMRLLAEYGE